MSASSAVQLSLPWTSSAEASRARTCPTPAPEPVSLEPAPGSGTSTRGSSRSSARRRSSSRTSADSWGGLWTSWPDGSPSSVTRWRPPGSSLPTSELLTSESGCSSSPWPTPTVRDDGVTGGPKKLDGRRGELLSQAAKWPTPTASDDKASGYNRGGSAGRTGPVRPGLRLAVKWATPRASDARSPGESGTAEGSAPLSVQARTWPTPSVRGNHNRVGLSERSGDGLATAAGTSAPLNPEWVEALMGFPPGWTELDPEELGRLAAERRNTSGSRRARSSG